MEKRQKKGSSGSFLDLVLIFFFLLSFFFFFSSIALMHNMPCLCFFQACATHMQKHRRNELLILNLEGVKLKGHYVVSEKKFKLRILVFTRLMKI